MDIVTIENLSGRIYFRNEDRCAYFTPKQKITRHVEAKILEQAGVLV